MSRLISLRRGLPVIDWTRVATRYLPFADAASPDLPLGRLARLSLFQVSVGAVAALMVGTLNRVMIVELSVAAWLVAAMLALPLLAAPFRALIGLKSDLHRSFLGWKRVPFIWVGTLLVFGGLAIMPFALVLLTGTTPLQLWAGRVAAALAFLMAGAGGQVVQTAGLALATDLAAPATRPRVVALMYVMLLLGLVGASAVYGWLLQDYTHTRLVQVVQGTAVVCVFLNLLAVWKQEPRNSLRAQQPPAQERFRTHWRRFAARPQVRRFLLTVGLGALAFNMQDVILEPYGGEILKLGVSATTQLTGLMALGSLSAFALAARWLSRGADPHRVAAAGLMVGVFAFSAVIFAEPLEAPNLFRAGAILIGVGGGLFAVGTLSAAMELDDGQGLNGMVLGAWGAVQATCAGIAVGLGGLLRDLAGSLAEAGWLGEVLQDPVTGYSVVYHLEWALLFATLIALGPLVRRRSSATPGRPPSQRLGLADLPG
ncbi:MAG: BCD family MFS transporter [Rubrivivax sp.]|nr:BCD family MFS transporter [Rubrivivax sp.]